MEYTIGYAKESDYDFFFRRDTHLNKRLLRIKLEQNEILVMRKNQTIIGWLRFSYFWDNSPFMNLLWMEDDYRLKGLGRKLTREWEKLMRDQGYKMLMTSTQANEEAQHFYRKLGYKDAGSLLLADEPLEIIFIKNIE